MDTDADDNYRPFVSKERHLNNKSSSQDNDNRLVCSSLVDEEKGVTSELETTLQELGIGRFQYTTIVLYGITMLYSSFSYVGFIFTAADIDYRCLIIECENETGAYKPEWLYKAVPIDANNHFSKCDKFSRIDRFNLTGSSDCNRMDDIFDRNNVVGCAQRWIFSREETSIASEFGITCDRKKLTLVGTLNSVGQLVGSPLAGFLADRYGRKSVIIIGSMTTAIFGLLRSFSNNYFQFLICEFLEAVCNTGIYSSSFMLGIELISSEHRAIAGALISNFYSIGVVLMGFVMWWLRDWRLLLRVLYMPGFLFIFYIWLVPESIHWLQMKRRHRDVLKILSKAARMNDKYDLYMTIKNTSPELVAGLLEVDNGDKEKNAVGEKWSKLLQTAFTSKIIVTRTVVCSYCWVAITLVYYGISFNSVDLSIGSKYLNFVLIHLVEIPAYLISLAIMKYCGRRSSQLVILFICGIGCVSYQFISEEMIWIKSSCYVINKLMITISSGIIHVYTAEIFPTELRVFLNGVCTTIGRIGCILAPQISLLNIYFGPYAVVLLFGIVTISAGLSTLLLPETMNTALKSTVREIQME